MKELSNHELIHVRGGGGFAHDVGCAIRYGLVFAGYANKLRSFSLGRRFAEAATSGGCS